MTLILGLYGTNNVWLGPNSSFLIKPTSVFVQSVVVRPLYSLLALGSQPFVLIFLYSVSQRWKN